MGNNLTVVNHPLINHKLTRIRDKSVEPREFRETLDEITMLLAYEVTKSLRVEECVVQTPLMEYKGERLAGIEPAVIVILRAALGFLPAMLKLLPHAKTGHIGMSRDHETLRPIHYYCKLPTQLSEREIILLDPMLATGYSAVAAVDFLKQEGASNIRFMCLIASPEGVEVMREHHPDVMIYTAALDEKLNEKGYILPGIGDAGDRIFGTN